MLHKSLIQGIISYSSYRFQFTKLLFENTKILITQPNSKHVHEQSQQQSHTSTSLIGKEVKEKEPKHSKKDKKKNGKKDKPNQRKQKVNENNCNKSNQNNDVAMSGDKCGVMVGQVDGTHGEPPSKKRRVSNDVATSQFKWNCNMMN